MHLAIDGYGRDPHVMEDEVLIRELLDSYPGEIGMTKITEPIVLRYVGTKPEDWGVSGFVMIAESHISIHTFVDRCFVNIDVFSCKEFDADRVIRDLTEKLNLVKVNSYILTRGLEYLGSAKSPSVLIRETTLATSNR
jgi:S-adenosylmethionine decarboxylase